MYVQCTVKIEIVIGLCTGYSADWENVCCVYSDQCRVRLFLVCVQCTVKCETVVGVCRVHSAD